MGHAPADWEGAGHISPSCDAAADGEDAKLGRGQDVDITPPPLGEAMSKVGLMEIKIYIARCQKIDVEYILTRPMMDLCLVAGRNPGEWI